MRFLFVSPISDVWNERKHVPLGLEYLSAVLLQAGHEVRMFDAAVEEGTLRDLLDREHFDIVGVTATTPLIYEAWQAALAAREHGAFTILGGTHPTLMPEESLEQPQVDMVVRGEGEDTILEIAEVLGRVPGELAENGQRRLPQRSLGKRGWNHLPLQRG